MYLLIIYPSFLNDEPYLVYENKTLNMHLFTTEQNAEDWIDKLYLYKIVPDYKIIEFDEIDPDITEELVKLKINF